MIAIKWGLWFSWRDYKKYCDRSVPKELDIMKNHTNHHLYIP